MPFLPHVPKKITVTFFEIPGSGIVFRALFKEHPKK
jgi:hypothetical protein